MKCLSGENYTASYLKMSLRASAKQSPRLNKEIAHLYSLAPSARTGVHQVQVSSSLRFSSQ